MRRFEYKGEMLTIDELMPFSSVPKKTLRGRLCSGVTIWSVESALNTSFGEKGKTAETSSSDASKIEKISKPQKQTKWGKPSRNEEEFYCVGCRRVKSIKLVGRTNKSKSKTCSSCCDGATKAANRAETEINIAKSRYKNAQKSYGGDLSESQLWFITGESK